MSFLANDLELDSALTLSQAAVGCDFQIREVDGPECRQLREIGFCEEMRVRKITNGRNMLCTVCGTRLAVSKDLADQIKVVPASNR
jgi:ferrous iron transport protein A